MNSNKSKKQGPRVLLGLSGGVDSSVSALLLKKQGYEVIAAFMKCFSDNKDPLTGECSWRKDLRDAQKIASKLNLKFIVLDFEKEYKSQVIKPMLKAYSKGLTPNPDISCNTIIKFPLLWRHAKKLNCDYIATGHYAKIKKTKSGYQLLQGKDKTKDQSYFLYELSQSDLSHTIFPMGNLTKSRVRSIAKSHKFPNWDKKGTRGICFVGKINFNKFLKAKLKTRKGRVLSPEGIELGTHLGNHLYTIGQKANPSIGISISKPRGYEQKRFYIAEKKKNNIIIVAPENHSLLKKTRIKLESLKLINPKTKIPKQNLKARIRHLGKLHAGKLIRRDSTSYFLPKSPIQDVSPGQYIVLYHRNKLIGGSEISN